MSLHYYDDLYSPAKTINAGSALLSSPCRGTIRRHTTTERIRKGERNKRGVVLTHDPQRNPALGNPGDNVKTKSGKEKEQTPCHDLEEGGKNFSPMFSSRFLPYAFLMHETRWS